MATPSSARPLSATPSKAKPSTASSSSQGHFNSSKRKHHSVDTIPAPTSTATSWFGLAVQLPSVIKREINDFVKTVRGGQTHPPLVPVRRSSTRNTSRSHAQPARRRLSRSSGTCDQQQPIVYPAPAPSSLCDDLDRPSAKKPKLSPALPITASHSNPVDAATTQASHSNQLKIPNTMDPFGLSGSMIDLQNADNPLSKPQDTQAVHQQPNEEPEEDAEMEEILATRDNHLPTSLVHPSGSNSVLFPDSRTCLGQDSPSSSVNADVSSSTSHNSSFAHRQFSTATSFTSNTSSNLTGCEQLDGPTVRLNSIGSVPSPRIRHTKLLGSPRAVTRPHSLSATSFSSASSFGTPNGLPSRSSRNLAFGTHQRTLVKGNSNSLSDLALQSHPWKQSENDSECLTNDVRPHANNVSAFKSFESLAGQTSISSRPKVPLAEIIGRPSNSSFQPSIQIRPGPLMGSYKLNPSPSITSMTSSIIRPQPVCSDRSSLMAESGLNDAMRMDRLRSQVANDSAEDSSISITETSSSLSNLRTHLSNTMHLHQDSAPPDNGSSLMSKSLPVPREYHREEMIMEVDEETEDASYEFLEREEAAGLSPHTPNRKRKRILPRSELHNLRRQGLAAIEQSSNKLVDLLPSQQKTKPKVNVMQKLGLGRSTNKRMAPVPEAIQGDISPLQEEDEVCVSPSKKIRILESEIARLSRELQHEKVKQSAGPVQRSSIRHSPSRSTRTPGLAGDIQRVKFSPQSAFSSSSPASPRPRRFRSSLAKSHSTSRSSGLSDSPVVLKKPSEGALVGGSPFIVPRVYGQGPEVVGEHTPVQADKWLQKQKLASSSQAGVRLPGLAHDLFGAKSSKSVHQSSSNASAAPVNENMPPVSTGWNRDQELDDDLFGTIKAPARQLSQISTARLNRTPGASTPLSPSRLRNMFRNSIGVQSGDKQGGKAEQLPDMASFLHELKSSGKDRLRKTAGSIKFYNAQHSCVSPKSSIGPQDASHQSRTVDPRNANILNLVLEQNFGNPSQTGANPCMGASGSRSSTMTCRTGTTACSTNTSDSNHSINNKTSRSLESAGETPRLTNAEDHASSSERLKTTLSRKIYPSSSTPKKTVVGRTASGTDVEVALGEAISTPKRTPQAGELSRSLIDPHRTPRGKSVNHTPGPTSPMQTDFTVDELIEQVKDLKQHQGDGDGQASQPSKPTVENPGRNHELVHEMGLCSSIENSFEHSPRRSAASGGSRPSATPTRAVTNSQTVFQDGARPRSSPVLKSVTQGRPKPSTSPLKNLPLSVQTDAKRWSSSSNLGLVSILNRSSSETESGYSGRSMRGSMSSSQASTRAGSEKRVRIVEDQSGLSRSKARSSEQSRRRHSMPAGDKEENLASLAEVEDEELVGVGARERAVNRVLGSGVEPGRAESGSGSEWVVLKSDSNRQGDEEPNLKRWSLKASAIVMANPKIV